MPGEILLMILSLMPIKDVVATGGLSTRWKFLWCNLIHLNFDGGQVLDKMAKIPKLRDSGRSKYINQVNSIIQSHKGPKVQEFRIHFEMDNSNKSDIDYWLQFAANKQVEILELDFMDYDRSPILSQSYVFPLQLSTADELRYLKKLVLKGVNVREEILQRFLTNSPHLETLSIHGSGYLTDIVVGGQALNLKHFIIVNCFQVESIYLHEFDLLSFSYKGPAMDLRLADLLKIKELDICQGFAGLENDIFRQIMASCVSYIQVLSLHVFLPMQCLLLTYIPKLPNVKKLRLTIGASHNNCLLAYRSIWNACPSLETFTVELIWKSTTKRKVRHDATRARPYNHLRLFEVLGYYGRMSDLELITYIIEKAVSLKTVLIDPRCQGWNGDSAINILKAEETARSYAHAELKSVTPAGVKLVIL